METEQRTLHPTLKLITCHFQSVGETPPLVRLNDKKAEMSFRLRFLILSVSPSYVGGGGSLSYAYIKLVWGLYGNTSTLT